MKKLFTLMAMTAFVAGAYAQPLFSDDFESYSAGDYIGVESDVWTTWSGEVGGPEDAQVDTNQANSGSNAVYFSSPAAGAGGPQDVILPFGQVYTEGLFTFSTSMRVTNNKQGYFNIQAEIEPGITWALDVTANNGMVTFDEGQVTKASGTYTPEEWFEISIEADLTWNSWKAYIDDELVGTFSNGANQVASVDIFPVAGADFWIDDVSFDWQTTVGLDKLPEPEADIKLYPNPSEGLSFIQIDLETAEHVSVDILSVDGRLVSSSDYGVLANSSRLPVNIANYAAGIYLVKIKVGNTQKVLKLLVD